MLRSAPPRSALILDRGVIRRGPPEDTFLKSPKRIWNDYRDTDRNLPFYEFAAAVFLWLGLAPSWQAFREVSERWDSSREFSKRAIKVLLFGAGE
jgi:hypothetical protein